MTDDIRPYPAKEHRHYFTNAIQIKNAFEPFRSDSGKTLYEMVEYSYMACNCGETVKSKVRVQDNEQ